MSDALQTTDVEIMGKKFQYRCPPSKGEMLKQAALYLDRKIADVSETGKALGSERILVTAALNITYELLMQQGQKNQYIDSMGTRIRDLQYKIDKALSHKTDDKI